MPLFLPCRGGTLLIAVDDLLPQAFGRDVLAVHAQEVLGGLGLRNQNPEYGVHNDDGGVAAEEEQHHEQTHPERIFQPEVARQARQYTAHHLVARVAEQLAAADGPGARAGRIVEVVPQPPEGLAGLAVRAVGFGAVAVLARVGKVLGPADAADDVLHVLNGDGHCAVLAQVFNQFGHAVLNVVGNFVAVLTAREVLAHVVLVFLQQFVGIPVHVVDGAEEVYLYVLFHGHDVCLVSVSFSESGDFRR